VDIASLRALHVDEQLVEGVLCVCTLDHELLLDDIPPFLDCWVLLDFKHRLIREMLVQEVAGNLVLTVPTLQLLSFSGSRVVRVNRDGAWL